MASESRGIKIAIDVSGFDPYLHIVEILLHPKLETKADEDHFHSVVERSRIALAILGQVVCLMMS